MPKNNELINHALTDQIHTNTVVRHNSLLKPEADKAERYFESNFTRKSKHTDMPK